EVRIPDQPQDGKSAGSHHSIRCDVYCRRGDRMRRREFVTILGGAAAWPLEARAQQRTMWAIECVSGRSPGESAVHVAAFREGLSEKGFIEGNNLAIAFRWAEGHYDRLPALCSELVQQGVAVLVAVGGPPSRPRPQL